MESLNTSIAQPDGTEAQELFSHFSPPVIDGTCLKVYEEEFFPVAPLILNTRQIQFSCPPCQDFSDLSNSQIEIDIKIVNANGGAIAPAAKPDATTPNASVGFDNNVIGKSTVRR